MVVGAGGDQVQRDAVASLVRNVGLNGLRQRARPAPVHVRPYRSPPAGGDSRRDRCPGRQRGGATRCGGPPSVSDSGSATYADSGEPTGANRTSGRFVGASWSILAAHPGVDRRARTAGRTIDRSTAGPLRACPVARCRWEARALFPLVCAGEPLDRVAIEMHRALRGGRMADVVRATCGPSCGRLLDVVVWNRQSSSGADCSTRASSRSWVDLRSAES